MPERFVPFITLYRETAMKAGHDALQLPVSINSHVYVSGSSQEAANEFFPSYSRMMQRIGRERGWPPMTREQFDYMRSEKGSLVVGSPQQVIDKILYEHELFQHSRFLAQMSLRDMPHHLIMRSIELFATRVAPEVRKALNTSLHITAINREINEKII
jgi:alkanesulfonate monooxygenase SsuD/methylene tetrahydromethanopterin reductase-like flavin-dependent oxidoreductase (luciferase family)